MNGRLSTVLITAAAVGLLTSVATAQDLKFKVPLPPTPKIVVPKPPAPKVRIEAPRSSSRKVSRSRRRYDYYPDAQVYFDPLRGLYFFLEANRWAARAVLPPEIKVRVGPPVIVDLETDDPYEFHDEVTRIYPNRQEDRSRYSYRAGFDDGYEEGYSDGYNAGYKASYDQGYRDGYRACVNDRGRFRDRDEDRPIRGRDRIEDR